MKNKLLLKLLIITIALLTGIILSIQNYNKINVESANLPNTINKTKFDAVDRLRLEGFNNVIVFPEEAENHWIICEQDPKHNYNQQNDNENIVNIDTQILLSASKSCNS